MTYCEHMLFTRVYHIHHACILRMLYLYIYTWYLVLLYTCVNHACMWCVMETLFYTYMLHIVCVCCLVYVNINVCLGPSSQGGADFLGSYGPSVIFMRLKRWLEGKDISEVPAQLCRKWNIHPDYVSLTPLICDLKRACPNMEFNLCIFPPPFSSSGFPGAPPPVGGTRTTSCLPRGCVSHSPSPFPSGPPVPVHRACPWPPFSTQNPPPVQLFPACLGPYSKQPKILQLLWELTFLSF